MSNSIMNTYGRLPVTFERGEGVWLFDRDGNRYLDALSGIGVCALGHADADVAEAISAQAKRLLHTSNLYQIDNQQVLADKLTNISGMTNCFFSNSGAEANEAAIKIARKYGYEKGIETPTIITFNRSFHGRTLATLTATGNSAIKQGFGPLPDGFIHLDYNNPELVDALSDNPNIVAVFVEPVQGEGGLNVPDDNYLDELYKICRKNNWLLMLDEVQTGNGRTGTYFAYQHHDFIPDVVTTAKGLGNGVPIGACLAHGEAAGILVPGTHGSTYGGNPLATAAALTTVGRIYDGKLTDHAAQMGTYLLEQFKSRLADNNKVANIRGKGLMLGIELTEDCTQLVAEALDKGALINVTAGKVIRLLPPLIIQQEEADQLVDIVCDLIAGLG
ncbi:Acetylornithine aminotransferase [BD1-7 clade bacterium]|uniref:Acetylornithine aminotransferase n=1 Tax=BD1-7 clade bacterium TaxID=2029982 RepID=A0A5S9P457_9GAMM|nr:Acetylornithine aminotransferase [BD1-7 clade bacterium]CAA0098085.1 Acetylornithine aminotransferase [BD1-7 clade bacterium]